jgi:hypothetical protein
VLLASAGLAIAALLGCALLVLCIVSFVVERRRGQRR